MLLILLVDLSGVEETNQVLPTSIYPIFRRFVVRLLKKNNYLRIRQSSKMEIIILHTFLV